MKRRHAQSGMSLLELMIGSTISLILIAGLYQIFNSSKAAHNRVIAQARQQENGRFALQFMRRGLKNAGFRTVPETLPAEQFNDSNNPVISGQDSTVVLSTLSNPVEGGSSGSYEVTSADIRVGSSTITETNVLLTSDVITVRYQGGELGAEDEATIRNCFGDDINQLHNVDAGTGEPEYIIEYAVDTYYAGLGTNEQDGVDRFHLYCRHARWTSSADGSSQSVEASSREKLVADVMGLQVRLGVDTNGDNVVDQYQTFTDGPDLSAVRSVELVVSVKAGAPSDLLEVRSAQRLTSTETAVEIRDYTQLVNLRNLSR